MLRLGRYRHQRMPGMKQIEGDLTRLWLYLPKVLQMGIRICTQTTGRNTFIVFTPSSGNYRHQRTACMKQIEGELTKIGLHLPKVPQIKIGPPTVQRTGCNVFVVFAPSSREVSASLNARDEANPRSTHEDRATSPKCTTYQNPASYTQTA